MSTSKMLVSINLRQMFGQTSSGLSSLGNYKIFCFILSIVTTYSIFWDKVIKWHLQKSIRGCMQDCMSETEIGRPKNLCLILLSNSINSYNKIFCLLFNSNIVYGVTMRRTVQSRVLDLSILKITKKNLNEFHSTSALLLAIRLLCWN